MASKKKKTATKKSVQRPPRTIWIAHNPNKKHLVLQNLAFERREDLERFKEEKSEGYDVVGPYVLAERVKNR